MVHATKMTVVDWVGETFPKNGPVSMFQQIAPCV